MVELIKPLVRATARPGADAEIGGFGGLFDLKRAGFKDPVLVAATDGVGTKVKIAIETGRHDTIGIDLVAMWSTTSSCRAPSRCSSSTTSPRGKLEPEIGAAVVAGIADGCRQAGCALIGGETAEMPGSITAATTISPALRSAPSSAARSCRAPTSRAGDVDARPRLVRRAFQRLFAGAQGRRQERAAAGARRRRSTPTQTLGEALLTPTRIYVKSCLAAIRETKAVKALAHITGGGFPDNIPRVLPKGLARASISARVPVLPVFQWLAERRRHRARPKCCAPSTAASA